MHDVPIFAFAVWGFSLLAAGLVVALCWLWIQAWKGIGTDIALLDRDGE